MSIVRPEKMKCFMQTLREQFHSVKGAEISHENMTEEGLKSRLISSDNSCILTFSIASIYIYIYTCDGKC